MSRGQGVGRIGTCVAVVAILVSTVVAACGLPTDSAPDSVALPVELTSTTSTTTTLPPQETTEWNLYMVRESRLAQVERPVQTPVTPERVWEQLLGGATSEEAGMGIRSSLPVGLEIIDSVITGDGTMVVDLNAAIDDIEGTALVQAVAQLVYTGTEFQTVNGVQFRVEGVFRPFPAGDGTVSPVAEGEEPEPLRRSDYSELTPPITEPA
jgi:hypothetical protein